MSRRVVLVTVLVALVAPARAPAQAKFTLDQLGKIVAISSPNVSPDGKSVVFVVAKPNYTNDKNESDIYLVDIAGGASTRTVIEYPGLVLGIGSGSFILSVESRPSQANLVPLRSARDRSRLSIPGARWARCTQSGVTRAHPSGRSWPSASSTITCAAADSTWLLLNSVVSSMSAIPGRRGSGLE